MGLWLFFPQSAGLITEHLKDAINVCCASIPFSLGTSPVTCGIIRSLQVFSLPLERVQSLGTDGNGSVELPQAILMVRFSVCSFIPTLCSRNWGVLLTCGEEPQVRCQASLCLPCVTFAPMLPGTRTRSYRVKVPRRAGLFAGVPDRGALWFCSAMLSRVR